MSLISNLLNHATNNNGYASMSFPSNHLLDSIELGVNERYYAHTDEHGKRTVEVWLHLNRPISADECAEFKTIVEENDIPEHDIYHNGKYDYHLSYFSVAWLEDLFPRLSSEKIDNRGTKQPNEILIESALKSGCHILDLSTMTIC